MKKLILLIIPILIGGIITNLVFQRRENKKETAISPITQTYQDSSLSSSVEAREGTLQSLEEMILSSQILLSKSIEVSKENENDSQMKQRNERIIELVNEAIATINQAVNIYPYDPRPWAQRAKIYQTIKGYMPEAGEAAIANWQRAIRLDPTNADYCQNLAEIYLHQGEVRSAIFYLEKAADSNPADVALLKQLAEKYAKVGMLTKARKSYQKVLAILTDKSQKEIIEKEITSLERLIAQSTANDQIFNHLSAPEEITLPDSPPLLKAQHLAGTIIAAPEEKENSEIESKIDTNALSGKAIIPAGETEIDICNDHLSPQTQVYLVSEGEIKNLVLMVKRKVPYNPETDKCSHFTAAIKSPLEENLDFRWWIID